MESATLLRRLLPQANDAWGLLLSWHRTGGFRQIVTHKGELIFTRLTPPLPFDADSYDITQAIARDVRATRDYLARLGLDDHASLHAAVILPDEVHKALAMASLPVQSLLTLTPHQAAQQLDLPITPSPDDAAADILHAGWLMRKLHPRAVLMRPATRQITQTLSIRRWGIRAACATWIIALAMLGWQGQDLLQLGLANNRLASENSMLQNQLAQERTTLAPATEPLGRLQQAVERRRLYTTPANTPWPLFDSIGPVISSDFYLSKLDWHDTEKLEISLRLTNDAETKPQAAQRFDQLASAMQERLSGYQVAVTHYPFPVMPSETLSNDHATDRDATIMIRKVSQ